MPITIEVFRRRARQIDPGEPVTPDDDELTPAHVTPSIVAMIGVWTSADRPNRVPPAGADTDGQTPGPDKSNPERELGVPVVSNETLDDAIEQAAGDTAATVVTVAVDAPEMVMPIDNL